MLSRFSSRRMFVAIAFVAMSIASICYPSAARILFLKIVAIIALPIAALGIIYRRGERQAFWVGFAVFGLSWGIATWQLPDSLNTKGLTFTLNFQAELAARENQMQLENDIAAQQTQLSRIERMMRQPTKSPSYVRNQKQLALQKQRLSQMENSIARGEVSSLLVLMLVAFAGSWLGTYFYRTQQSKSAQDKSVLN